MKNVIRILGIAFCLTVASCAKTQAAPEAKPEAAATEAAANTPDKKSSKTSHTPAKTLPTVYDFSATWCGPCKVFAPTFHKMAQNYEGKVNFVTVDIDRNSDMARRFRITSVPTVVAVSPEGNEIGRRIGLMDWDEFSEFIKATVAPAK